MPILLLIRHGETEYSKKGKLAGRLPGVHLNAGGREQADALAAALAQAPIKAVYSSPLERAMETAAPIARARGLQIIKEAGLLESDVGRWQGKSIRRLALSKEWRLVQHSPSRAGHPGGETFLQTQQRVVAAIDQICAGHRPGDLVACVLHADPIKLALSHYLGLPLDRFQRLGCDTGSVALLNVGVSGATLLNLNLRPPFELEIKGRKGR
jgi:probable phosphoglycerate mutase